MNSYVFRVINQIQQLDLLPGRLRRSLLRFAGVKFTGTPTLFCGIDFVPGELRIEAGAFVNRGVLIEAQAGITIGELVHIGPRAQILTSTHHLGDPRQRAAAWVGLPVTIGAGSWIGAGAIILPGVNIGAGTVVAAGAVVTQDTEPNCLYAGVPAVKKRALQ